MKTIIIQCTVYFFFFWEDEWRRDEHCTTSGVSRRRENRGVAVFRLRGQVPTLLFPTSSINRARWALLRSTKTNLVPIIFSALAKKSAISQSMFTKKIGGWAITPCHFHSFFANKQASRTRRLEQEGDRQQTTTTLWEWELDSQTHSPIERINKEKSTRRII
jgi:hypothetical protein